MAQKYWNGSSWVEPIQKVRDSQGNWARIGLPGMLDEPDGSLLVYGGNRGGVSWDITYDVLANVYKDYDLGGVKAHFIGAYGEEGREGAFNTAQKVDLTGYNTLKFLAGVSGKYGRTKVSINPTIPTGSEAYKTARTAEFQLPNAGTETTPVVFKVHTLDVSSLSGSYYILFEGETGGGTATNYCVNSSLMAMLLV